MTALPGVPCKRVDHTAIVVSDLNEAIPRWQRLTGARLSIRELVPHQRVEIAMLEIHDTRVELISPTDATSGVARFLGNRGESLHHMGLEVDDITETIEELSRTGFEFIDRIPRPGAHGLIAFIHPRSTGGVLVELIQCDKQREDDRAIS